jgi:hypothetical protein
MDVVCAFFLRGRLGAFDAMGQVGISIGRPRSFSLMRGAIFIVFVKMHERWRSDPRILSPISSAI